MWISREKKERYERLQKSLDEAQEANATLREKNLKLEGEVVAGARRIVNLENLLTYANNRLAKYDRVRGEGGRFVKAAQ
ncbi:hypothetical protein [uncultured Alistipes sp.]|jgi:hypothetical protein|uniref:hypothetical protein n=1 Tax=uncultured Alistipes sp. TaxID=538949 RepID=UPI0027D9C780|nr:hypothetical protein [uncultured Alistipes sp.]